MGIIIVWFRNLSARCATCGGGCGGAESIMCGSSSMARCPSLRQRSRGGDAASSRRARRPASRAAPPVRAYRVDPQAQGVLLRINGLAAGWATLQSLRDEIAYFRSSGKRASPIR